MAMATMNALLSARGFVLVDREALSEIYTATERERHGIACLCHPADPLVYTAAMADQVARMFTNSGLTFFFATEEPFPELPGGVTVVHFEGC